MAKLVPESHPALHAIAEEVPVEEITSPRIRKVIKDMRAVLASYDGGEFTGVAIAAPQIGVSLRMFLIEDAQVNGKKNKGGKEKTGPEPHLPSLVAINPRIIKLSKKKMLMNEGCLSVDQSYGAVERSVQATLCARDERGKSYERGAAGLLAQIFQHEVDHLDGILFLDRADDIIHKDLAPREHAAKSSMKFSI
jgi:peptide deformylase